ncbi:MAG: hypothetical protein JW841_08990 [Deltaproteobacteria bacterium]|nr:hypothetical protein [Deltaproteobacteria bacterium]
MNTPANNSSSLSGSQPSSKTSGKEPDGFQTHQDRSMGLMWFGIIALIIGSFSGCFSIITTVGALNTPAGETGDSGAFMAFAIYGGFAAFMIASGLASMRRRRWMRPLMIIASWVGLSAGVLGIAMIIAMRNELGALIKASMPAEQPIPPGMLTLVFIVGLSIVLFIAVIIPIAFIVFYSSRNVIATLNTVDPKPSWPERVPLSVLGLSISLGLAAYLILIAMSYGSISLFGSIIKGPVAVLILFAIAMVLGALAFTTYQLRPIGFWGTVVGSLLALTHGIFNYWSPNDLLTLSNNNISATQMQAMQQFTSDTRLPMLIMLIVFSAIWFVYLAFLKKYFKPQSPSPNSSNT